MFCWIRKGFFLSSSLAGESAGLLEHYSTHLDIHLHGQYRGRVRLVGGHDTWFTRHTTQETRAVPSHTHTHIHTHTHMFVDQYASWDWPTPSLVGLQIFARYLTVFESEQNSTHKPTWATSTTATKMHIMACRGNRGMAPLITLENEIRYPLNRRLVWAPENICMFRGK